MALHIDNHADIRPEKTHHPTGRHRIGNVGFMYEIRAAARREQDDFAWEQDLTRAIAFHLASGEVERATELSAFFMPSDEVAGQVKLSMHAAGEDQHDAL